MSEFNNFSDEQKRRIFVQTGARTGLVATAVEKDWWVTQLLDIVFSLPYSEAFVFKGGTSLSKGYSLIERFSEDIDLAIDRGFFGMGGDLSRSQIQKLRKKSARFISTELLGNLSEQLAKRRLDISSIGVEPFKDSDTNPLRIFVGYKSLTAKIDYLSPRILLEISCRSLREPYEHVPVLSLIDHEFSSSTFSNKAFQGRTVEPKRTFWEKILLLHEEWQKADIRVDRLSRHLYDLERLMDTHHAHKALEEKDLFLHIVEHRRVFSSVRGVDYNNHTPSRIQIIPPENVRDVYRNDYDEMRSSMFVGKSLPWEHIITRLLELQEKIRALDW